MKRRNRKMLLPVASIVLALPVGAPAFAQTQASPQPARVQASDTAAEEVPTIEVVGRRESGAYESGDTEGTKTSWPLKEIPQAVRVITRQTVDDLGAYRLDDVLDYVGGVSRQNNFGGLWDNIAIRGLAGNENTGMPSLLNGFSGNRGFNAPRDTANLERVEFLKGPVSSLYGTSEPGGTINLVTKKPRWQSAQALEAYAGSFGFGRLALDATGPLSEALAFRLNAAIEDRDSFRRNIDSHRTVLAPALALRISPATRVDYSGEWLRHETQLDRGVVAINNRLGAVPRSQFLGEPADGRASVDNQTHQLTMNHVVNPDWQLRAGLSYKTGTFKGFSTEPSALQADQETLRRQRRFRDYTSDDLVAQTEVIGNLRHGALMHELVVGVEAYQFNIAQRMLRVNPSNAAPYAINVFNPVYGQSQPTPLPNTDTRERQDNLAFYLQDSIRIGPDWRAVLGLRSDHFDQRLDNLRTNTRTEQRKSALSPRLGVGYLFAPGWSAFANAGQSFRPNPGSDAAGSAFEPESGQSLEVGAKWESADRRLGAGVTLFDIRKRNVVTADPANTGFSIATGKVRSRGLELDLAGQISRHWRLNASLALIDASVTQDNTLEVGGRLLNVPKVNGSLLAVYENSLNDGRRYGIGGGITHVGKRLGEARTQEQANSGTEAFDLPSYTTVKALAYVRVNKSVRVSLDVDNLFDATYYTSSFSRVWVTPGPARTITLGVQARF